ncbi:hypothetical protein D3C73_1288750 [compost metagenome]
MLGILKNQQRINEQRAAHLVIPAPGHCRYADFERKIIGARQIPGAADRHADFAGDEGVAVLACNTFAPLRGWRDFILEYQIEQLLIGGNHLW